MNKRYNFHPVKILGTGTFLPGNPLTIEDVDKVLGKIDKLPGKLSKWLERTRSLFEQMLEVESYYFAIDPATRAFTEDNITMSVKAARKALERAKIKPSEIDFIAYGSAHQDQMPTASVRIQEKLGIEKCAEISIHSNCTSAYKALMVASDFIKMGRYKTALVLSSNISSSELRAEYYNPEKITKEQLFLRYFLSDGAGAVLLQADNKNERKGFYIEETTTESIGGLKPSAMYNQRPAYWMNPMEEYKSGKHHLSQMFSDELRNHFFENGSSIFYAGLKRMLNTYQIDTSKIKYFQVDFPSKHISELVLDECTKLGINPKSFYTKMSTLGYVGPPMAFFSLDKIINEENISSGDIILSFVTEVSKFMQAGFTCQYY